MTDSDYLNHIRQFLVALPGEAGLSASGVSHLRSIAFDDELRTMPERRHFTTERPVRATGTGWQFDAD